MAKESYKSKDKEYVRVKHFSTKLVGSCKVLGPKYKTSLTFMNSVIAPNCVVSKKISGQELENVFVVKKQQCLNSQ